MKRIFVFHFLFIFGIAFTSCGPNTLKKEFKINATIAQGANDADSVNPLETFNCGFLGTTVITKHSIGSDPVRIPGIFTFPLSSTLPSSLNSGVTYLTGTFSTDIKIGESTLFSMASIVECRGDGVNPTIYYFLGGGDSLFTITDPNQPVGLPVTVSKMRVQGSTGENTFDSLISPYHYVKVTPDTQLISSVNIKVKFRGNGEVMSLDSTCYANTLCFIGPLKAHRYYRIEFKSSGGTDKYQCTSDSYFQAPAYNGYSPSLDAVSQDSCI